MLTLVIISVILLILFQISLSFDGRFMKYLFWIKLVFAVGVLVFGI